MEKEKWKWQEEGTSWRGIGIYHVTLTIPSRQPLLGSLVIPDDDPAKAWVERTELGRLLLDCHQSVPKFHPEIQILQYCLMPDHLHTIWYVRRPMKQSIRQVVQGFWQATKKLGRAYSYIAALTDGTTNESSNLSLSSIAAVDNRENPLCEVLGADAYRLVPPIFSEMPFIRPMSSHGQLQAMIRYVQMNPQRLATKRLMPGFFRVQTNITLSGRTYSAVGNIILLSEQSFATVHVRSIWVKSAEHGDSKLLRDYMNSRVIEARRGVVMVSPFISPHEKQVMQVLLNEKHSFILLVDNGFREYYKPSDGLFDACAAGRVLILSPWRYDAGKRHISRNECVALNEMAEEIAMITNKR